MAHYHIRPQAEADLDELTRYIAKDNLDVALRLYDRTEETYALLAEMPNMGMDYRSQDPRLREKNLQFFPIKDYPNYLIFFVPISKGIEVIRVLHRTRNITGII